MENYIVAIIPMTWLPNGDRAEQQPTIHSAETGVSLKMAAIKEWLSPNGNLTYHPNSSRVLTLYYPDNPVPTQCTTSYITL